MKDAVTWHWFTPSKTAVSDREVRLLYSSVQSTESPLRKGDSVAPVRAHLSLSNIKSL